MKFKWSKYETLDNESFLATVYGLPGVIAAGGTIEHCREDLITSFHSDCSYSQEIAEPFGYHLYSYWSDLNDEILCPR
jgi:hypothetical protein